MEEVVKKEGSLVIDDPTEIIIPSAGPLETVNTDEDTLVSPLVKLAEDCEKKRIHDAGPIAFMGNSMPVIPKKGSMTFENNNADDALQTIKVLLSNARVNLSITWECC